MKLGGKTMCGSCMRKDAVQRLENDFTEQQGQQVRVKSGFVWRLERYMPTQQKYFVLK